MAVSDSNTYVSPAASKSLALSRFDFNNSDRAGLQNFYSEAEPTSVNIDLVGIATAPPDGTLFFSAKTNALFVADSVNHKGNPMHGQNFTRLGIGHRIEETLAGADYSTYEIGETFVTVGSNARMYMLSSNTGPTVVDIAEPGNDTIKAIHIQDGAVTVAKLASTLTAQVTIKDVDQLDYNNAALRVGTTVSGGNAIIGLTSDGSNNSAIRWNAAGQDMHFHGISASALVPINAGQIRERGAPLVPPGTISMYWATTPPGGYLACDGAAVSQTTYANLFAVIGTTWDVAPGGGNFNVPDLRARAPYGANTAHTVGQTTLGVDLSKETTTSSDGDHFHSGDNVVVSTSTKDAPDTNAVTGEATVAAHTHTFSAPMAVVQFIIKT